MELITLWQGKCGKTPTQRCLWVLISTASVSSIITPSVIVVVVVVTASAAVPLIILTSKDTRRDLDSERENRKKGKGSRELHSENSTPQETSRKLKEKNVNLHHKKS